MASPELYTATGVIALRRPKALYFRVCGSSDYKWIPLSQIKSFTFNNSGYDTVVLKAWLAKRLGFI